MPSTPPDYARWLSEPSIVIDPGLFADARPRWGRRLLCAALSVLRSVACVGVLGVTLFAVAHADKWLARGHGDVHAAERHAPTRMLAAATPAPKVLSAPAVEVESLAAKAPSAATGPVVEAGAADMLASEEVLHETLRKARRLLNQHRLDEADAAYSQVLSVRSRHPGALAGRARVQLARGELDRALELAQTAVRSAPAHAVYHVTLADVLRARGEPDAADVELAMAERLSQKPVDRAAKLLPDNPF